MMILALSRSKLFFEKPINYNLVWYIVQKQAQIQAIGTYKACFSRKLSIFEKHQFGNARVNIKLGISSYQQKRKYASVEVVRYFAEMAIRDFFWVKLFLTLINCILRSSRERVHWKQILLGEFHEETCWRIFIFWSFTRFFLHSKERQFAEHLIDAHIFVTVGLYQIGL